MILRLLATLTSAVLLSSWTGIPSPTTANDAGVREAPLILGVNTHFGAKVSGSNYNPYESAKGIHRLSFESWRDVVSMSRYSRLKTGSADEQGVLRRFQAFANAVAAPRSPILIVGYWPEGSTSANRVQAFATALREGLVSYPHAKLIEVWNEWDKTSGNQTDGTVESYAALVKVTVPTVRRELPDATVLIGGAADDQSDLEFRWTRALLRRPEASLADGLSVHLYNHCSATRRNKAASDMIGRLDRLRADMVSVGKSRMRVYVTEFGWPTDGGRCHVTTKDAAAALVHFTLLAASRPWIAGIWYYELKDSGTNHEDIESHFGLYDFNMQAKPGVCAAATINRLVRSSAVVRTYEGDDLTAVLLRTGSTMQTVVWATKANAPAVLQLDKAVVARPLCAPPQTISGAYRLSGAPVFLPGDMLPRIKGEGGTKTLL